jgi:hypothetical protein
LAWPWKEIWMWAVTWLWETEKMICSPDWSMGVVLQKNPPQASAGRGDPSRTASSPAPAIVIRARHFMAGSSFRWTTTGRE